MTPSGNSDEIDVIRRHAGALGAERQSLENRLRELEKSSIGTGPAPQPAVAQDPAATNASPATDKIALFRRLFGGRTDVFPARWDNPKTGRSGYAPACANEWVRGVCGKPGNNVMAHGVASAESANRIENSLCAKLIICITHSCFDLLPRAAIPTSG
jgi:hypothetical protein